MMASSSKPKKTAVKKLNPNSYEAVLEAVKFAQNKACKTLRAIKIIGLVLSNPLAYFT